MFVAWASKTNGPHVYERHTLLNVKQYLDCAREVRGIAEGRTKSKISWEVQILPSPDFCDRLRHHLVPAFSFERHVDNDENVIVISWIAYKVASRLLQIHIRLLQIIIFVY